MKRFFVLSGLLLTACVTINIYFPAAAAEKAADELIKGIQKEQGQAPGPKSELKPQESGMTKQGALYKALELALEAFIPSAHAEADLNIDSPEIQQVSASMHSRFGALSAMYAQGYIGIQTDGLLTVRDPGAVPLKERNSVNQLVAAENADRQKLYQAIANANGHPEWLDQIKNTFAARWISNAQSGWWYQGSNGAWKQK